MKGKELNTILICRGATRGWGLEEGKEAEEAKKKTEDILDMRLPSCDGIHSRYHMRQI